ncbi:carbohydrate ABC transporter permease [Zhihengliuella halotolerans]|uniref:Carbohydrate ABC transporter membrane protein 1 (CUT1 family) n=1 Tax=Zhihengliuella halotolerans TaxID=370736 RepID=A0A4Q8AG60_9MICC|nr:sugar ABC transporter permease [Zhihengliuella halotolerans]RZU62831.1 carbohydrate ABC transporter membrane protein 1 (CUT1 family) [Zhihengliuella halotolerans]
MSVSRTEVQASVQPDRATRPAGSRKITFTGWLMAPGITLLGVLSIIPLVMLILMSFSKVRLLGGLRLEFAGLDNWARAFGDVELWKSWATTLAFFVSTLGIELVLGVAIAVALNRLVRGRGLVLPLILLPMFVAPSIVGLLGRYLLDPTFGLYANLLQSIGITQDVLGHPVSAFAAVVLMDVWEWTPLIALITLAGLSGVNPSVLEAASLDGASEWKKFWHMVLPSIRPILLVAILIRSMDAVRYFDIIYVTTNGGPADATKIIPVRLYEAAFRFFDLGYAAVIGIMMLVLTILIARFFVRLMGEKEEN